MGFWTQPDQIHYAQMAVSVGTCHLLAHEYYHLQAYTNAAILALNGAFLQTCSVSGVPALFGYHLLFDYSRFSWYYFACVPKHQNKSIDELKTWPAEKITRDNLPHFHLAKENLSKSPEHLSRYLSRVLPLRYQNTLQLEGHASQVPGMGYVDLISDDWNKTSHGSSGKNQRPDVDGAEIKIILYNQDNGKKLEKIIKLSTSLKSLFNTYADESGESLRALRFSYNGSTLFLSSLGQKTAQDLGMQDSDVISIFNNSSAKTEEPDSQQKKQSKKKNKPAEKKARKAKGKPKAQSQPIAIPQTEKELKVAHSLLLSKVFEEAEPKLKMIRQMLNELALDRQGPKDRSTSSKKKQEMGNQLVFNPNSAGLGGKAGKTSYTVNVGQVENLYISSKRKSIHSRSSLSSQSSIIDLHGCSRDEAIERLDSSLIDWVDTAMKGEYPWVIPATIVCGGGNQILSETVETWIKGKKNVANAPRGHLLC